MTSPAGYITKQKGGRKANSSRPVMHYFLRRIELCSAAGAGAGAGAWWTQRRPVSCGARRRTIAFIITSLTWDLINFPFPSSIWPSECIPLFLVFIRPSPVHMSGVRGSPDNDPSQPRGPPRPGPPRPGPLHQEQSPLLGLPSACVMRYGPDLAVSAAP